MRKPKISLLFSWTLRGGWVGGEMQGDICRALGFDRAQMSNIEAGKGNHTIATIEKIAPALGVVSDELLK